MILRCLGVQNAQYDTSDHTANDRAPECSALTPADEVEGLTMHATIADMPPLDENTSPAFDELAFHNVKFENCEPYQQDPKWIQNYELFALSITAFFHHC